jgi:hypothetical protein
MIPRVFPFLVVILVSAGFAADTESSRKQSELLKLLHYTKELNAFRDDIKGTVDVLRKSNPKAPFGFWDELEREVRMEDYGQWIIAIWDRSLTEGDVRELNAVMSDEKKKNLLEDLLRQLSGKKGDEFAAGVEKFKKSNDPRLAKEVVAFMQSETAIKYAAVLREKSAGQREIALKLLGEAQRRVNARRK